jgi:hypothetical protein
MQKVNFLFVASKEGFFYRFKYVRREQHQERVRSKKAGLRIRIQIGSGFNRVSGSGFGILIRIQEGKNDPQKWKSFLKVHVF